MLSQGSTYDCQPGLTLKSKLQLNQWHWPRKWGYQVRETVKVSKWVQWTTKAPMTLTAQSHTNHCWNWVVQQLVCKGLAQPSSCVNILFRVMFINHSVCDWKSYCLWLRKSLQVVEHNQSQQPCSSFKITISPLKLKTILMLVSERVLLHQRVQVSSSSSLLASYRKYQLARNLKIQASGLFPKHTNSSTTLKKSLTRPLRLRYVVPSLPWHCVVKNTQALHQAPSPPMTAGHKAF